MKKAALAFLLTLLCFFSNFVNAMELKHSQIFSFAHFLCGNSGIFPRGCSLNDLIWKHRMGEELKNNGDVSKVMKVLKLASENFPDSHAFECGFYSAAFTATNIEQFIAYIAEKAGLKKDEKDSFSKLTAEVFLKFKKCFYPKEDFIVSEIEKLGKSDTFNGFASLLSQQQAFLGCKDEKLDIKILAVPVFASNKEFMAFRESGRFNIFGLSLNEIQMIEVPIVEEHPEITAMAVCHLNAVALHEINHYLYHRSNAFKEAQRFFAEAIKSGAKLAGNFFTESIATAAGNGMASELFKNDDPQWYNNRVINKAAHEIFPVVRDYLKNGKILDKPFMENYLAAFNKCFPDAIEIPEISLTRIALSDFGFGESSDIHNRFKECIKKYLPSFKVLTDPEADSQTLSIRIILKPEFIKLGQKPPFAGNLLLRKLAEKSGNCLVFLPRGKEKSPNLVCLINSADEIDNLVRFIFSQERFSPIMKM